MLFDKEIMARQFDVDSPMDENKSKNLSAADRESK